MPRYNANSLLNSLKGKIWLATSAMAFFICSCGLISYLIASFLIDNTFYAVFVPFLLIAVGIMVSGWWLANEVVSPIEKVSLLAKSLERSATTSLPKTTGSDETDELLKTLHRNSQQIQNLISLMEEVVAGNTGVTLTPLKNSDRLSNAFQKLLAKISDSIDAKRELEKIQKAISQLTKDVSSVRQGNLQVEVSSESKELKEITETIKFLLNNLSEIVCAYRQETHISRSSADKIRKTLQSVIEQNEIKVQELNRAAVTLVEIPNSVQKISENLLKSAAYGNQLVETVRKSTKTSQQSHETIALVRKQLQETLSYIRRLHERSQEISQIVKTVEDLANRTNMIALNASIQADEADKKGGFAVITKEIGRLASRAANTNKQTSTLNKSILSEIGKAENSLMLTSKEIGNLSKLCVETSGSLDELEKYLSRFLNSQEQLTSESLEQSVQTEEAFQIFIGSISDNEKTAAELKAAEQLITRLSAALENLQNLSAFFRVVEPDSSDQLKDTSLPYSPHQNFEPKTKPAL